MTVERGDAVDDSGATVLRATGLRETAGARGTYFAECYGEDGQLKWADRADNIVTTAGANDLLDKYWDLTQPTTKYMGLVASSTGVFSTADTMASHAGWTESTIYTNGARLVPSWSAASAKSKVVSAAVAFSMGSSGIIGGAFMVSTSSAIGSTTGTLYSAGAFTGGPKVVSSGDTLNVTYTAAV